MLAFLRYIKGFLLIHIEGYSPERFMNLCRLNGIVLWDIIPRESYYECKIARADYPKIETFLQKTKISLLPDIDNLSKGRFMGLSIKI